MRKARVLFVSQEIVPFLPETTISSVSRHLPQGIHDKGKEIRVFTPRFGKINERRHQLHEVIRLSGMNMIINDSDHPLIIKVASIPTARMQVYFIDNEEFFHRKAVLQDEEGKFFEDNDERSIFFVRGVLETVRKLGWAPDIIHCHGWMTSLMPLYVKKLFNQDPHFSETKVVYSAYEQPFGDNLDANLRQKIAFDGIDESLMPHLEVPTLDNLHKTAISYSDAVINGSKAIDSDLESFIRNLDVPYLDHGGDENYISEIDQFYDGILEGKSILVEEP
jgi:starch synthase